MKLFTKITKAKNNPHQTSVVMSLMVYGSFNTMNMCVVKMLRYTRVSYRILFHWHFIEKRKYYTKYICICSWQAQVLNIKHTQCSFTHLLLYIFIFYFLYFVLPLFVKTLRRAAVSSSLYFQLGCCFSRMNMSCKFVA